MILPNYTKLSINQSHQPTARVIYPRQHPVLMMSWMGDVACFVVPGCTVLILHEDAVCQNHPTMRRSPAGLAAFVTTNHSITIPLKPSEVSVTNNSNSSKQIMAGNIRYIHMATWPPHCTLHDSQQQWWSVVGVLCVCRQRVSCQSSLRGSSRACWYSSRPPAGNSCTLL
jgi:hypothetical protein